MAVLPIVRWPDARLRQETHDVAEITDATRALYRDLCDTMFAENGLGIAGPQVGSTARIFLIDAVVAGGTQDDAPIAFINPTIVRLGDEAEIADEGCLSFPTIYVPVERALTVTVRALNLDGDAFEVAATDLYARALQHEHDHLIARLLVDHVGPLKKQMIKRKLKRLAAEERAAAG